MEAVLELNREFDETLEEAVGLYLDAHAAMIAYAAQIQKLQEQFAASDGVSVADQDALSYSYGAGDPTDPNSLHLHAVTQGELKSKNFKDGRNHVILGQRFIVDIYSYWEDSYRSRIADALSIQRNNIMSDVFGDIRLIRISFIHHRGISLPDVAKCKILNWFKEGDLIQIDMHKF